MKTVDWEGLQLLIEDTGDNPTPEKWQALHKEAMAMDELTQRLAIEHLMLVKPPDVPDDPIEEQQEPQTLANPPAGQGITLAKLHAPVGGAMIAGRMYPGGQFIPNSELAKATPEEKAELKKKLEAPKAEPKPKRINEETGAEMPDPEEMKSTLRGLGIDPDDLDEDGHDALESLLEGGDTATAAHTLALSIGQKDLEALEARESRLTEEIMPVGDMELSDDKWQASLEATKGDPAKAGSLVMNGFTQKAHQAANGAHEAARELGEKYPDFAAKTEARAEKISEAVDQIQERSEARLSARLAKLGGNATPERISAIVEEEMVAHGERLSNFADQHIGNRGRFEQYLDTALPRKIERAIEGGTGGLEQIKPEE